MIRRATLVMLCLCLTGCIGYQREIATNGRVPAPALLEQLALETITVEELQEHMGPASSVNNDASGSQLWVYDATATGSHQARALPVMAFRWATTNRVRYVFKVENGLVTDHWTDNS